MSELFEGLIKRRKVCQNEVVQCNEAIDSLHITANDMRLREVVAYIKRSLNLQNPNVRVRFPGDSIWIVEIGQPIHTTLSVYGEHSVHVIVGKGLSFLLSDEGKIDFIGQPVTYKGLNDFAEYMNGHREFFDAVLAHKQNFCTFYWRLCAETSPGYWITKLNYMMCMFFGRPKLPKDVRKLIWERVKD